MFFRVNLNHKLRLPPQCCGDTLHELVVKKVYADSEGKWRGDYGTIVYISKVLSVSPGKVLPDPYGNVSFDVSFEAITCRPIVGEVIHGVVVEMNAIGIYALAGPLRSFIAERNLPGMILDTDASPPAYRTKDESATIELEMSIGMRVINAKSDELFCVCSLVSVNGILVDDL